MEHVGPDYAFAHVEDGSGRIWVVRLALHAAAEAGQESELALLKLLAGASSGGALPFEVPRPRGSAALAGGGKAIVYAALPGVPVVMELMDPGPGIAESLGRAIGAFHELPPSIVRDAGFVCYTPSEYRTHLVSEVDDAVRTGHVSPRLEARWSERLDRDSWWVFAPVPIHGDMAAEHLLEHGGRISAMTDFASVQVSDPAEDLAQLLAPLPPDVAGSIVGAYRRRRADLDDPHLEDRAAFLGEIAIIRWLRHGIDLGDQTIIGDARGMLADLDQSVREEEAQAEREAAAEAEAHEKLEEAKRAAEADTRARREAAKRASEAAAREHVRTSGSIPRIADSVEVRTEAIRSFGTRSDGGHGPDLEPDPGGGADRAAAGADLDQDEEQRRPPERRSIAGEGVSVWGRPKKSTRSWKDAALPESDGEPAARAKAESAAAGDHGPDDAEPHDSSVRTPVGDEPSKDMATDSAASREHEDDEAPEASGAGESRGADDGAAAEQPADHAPSAPGGSSPAVSPEAQRSRADSDEPDRDESGRDGAAPDDPAPGSSGVDAPDVDDSDLGEPDSQELTQAFLPDFLKDDSEAPADILAAAAADETEALERPKPPRE
jgi:hypothetical protein